MLEKGFIVKVPTVHMGAFQPAGECSSFPHHTDRSLAARGRCYNVETLGEGLANGPAK